MAKAEYSNFTLTNAQTNALKAFRQFMHDRKNRIFVLRGYAGTGKTTLMRFFIDELKKADKNFQLLASTGRAAKILRDVTGNDASTVHSLIYQFKDFNQNLEASLGKEYDQKKVDKTGQLLLQFECSPVIHGTDETFFYIIDESSMLSDVADADPNQAMFGSGRLIRDLLDYDSQGKFVFVGDNCQLPPVNSALSPALSTSYLSENYDVDCVESELTEITRQSGSNDIITVATKLRRLAASPPVVTWAKFPMLGYQNIKVCSDQTQLLDLYIKDVKKNGYNCSTMICGTNKQCDLRSRLIRPALGFAQPTLQVGDLLLVTQNNALTQLLNGDLVKVVSIGEQNEKAGLTFLMVEVEELATKRRCGQFLIEDVLYGGWTNLSQAQQKALFVDFYYRMRSQGIRQNDQRFRMCMMNDPYLNALRAVFGYALTCHKCQGGEWKHVYIDIPRYLSHNASAAEYRWLYTALTRAQEVVYVANDFYLSK